MLDVLARASSRVPLPSGRTGKGAVTAQGHPRTRFQRAIEGRWLFHAELAARELGRLTLEEALELVVLCTRKVEPAKFERAAVRWFSRYLDEGTDVSLPKAHLALAALTELRSGEVDAAAKLLAGLL